MPRTVDITAPSIQIDRLLEQLSTIEGIVNLVRSGTALAPAPGCTPIGEQLSLTITNDAERPLFRLLDELGIVSDGSISTSEVTCLVARSEQQAINHESNETTWDEMAFLLRSDTNISFNYLMSMALAGAIAAGGIWSDTIHLIIGAMIIAPAFEPIARIPFGLVTRSSGMAKDGLRAASWGYLALIASAAVVTVLLGVSSSPKAPLPELQWVNYWTDMTVPGALTSAFGAIAGAVVIGGQRSVLTTGVMVTLALIPSAALVGMGIGSGELAIAGKGLARCAVDIALVLVAGAVVFGFKQRFVHRHHALS